jgi:hypothetical protein
VFKQYDHTKAKRAKELDSNTEMLKQWRRTILHGVESWDRYSNAEDQKKLEKNLEEKKKRNALKREKQMMRRRELDELARIKAEHDAVKAKRRVSVLSFLSLTLERNKYDWKGNA